MFRNDVYDCKPYVARAWEELANELQMFAYIDVQRAHDEGFYLLHIPFTMNIDASGPP